MNIRPRRNRKSAAIRAMVEETQLGAQHLIYPLFLKDGKNIREEVSSLPGNTAGVLISCSRSLKSG
jgi:porphobilinogen synthase